MISQYTMDASFLEIYNETVRDLLGAGDDKKKCEIKMATSKGTDVEVTNSTTVRVTSQSQVHSLLAKASHNRAVGATNCNERSSRSHSVFRLKLTGRNDLTDETCQGMWFFISERDCDSWSVFIVVCYFLYIRHIFMLLFCIGPKICFSVLCYYTSLKHRVYLLCKMLWTLNYPKILYCCYYCSCRFVVLNKCIFCLPLFLLKSF